MRGGGRQIVIPKGTQNKGLVLFLDFFFVFSDFIIYHTTCTHATRALYKMNNECVSLCCDFYLFVHTSCPSK